VDFALRVKKIINMVLMWDLRNFIVFSQGDVSPTHSDFYRFVSGSQAKHQVSSPILILLKKCLFALAITITSWLRCQGVWNKMCTQFSVYQILFQNPKNYSLGDVQRFCYHYSCNLMVIFDQISNSSNVSLSLS
jgi:hypothetical protein